ncbi:MAG: SH3 domain-containing protein [Lewinellaceae bacterium]|nr:SH3 domain-containing protein [Lewinellaceae bacterium]
MVFASCLHESAQDQLVVKIPKIALQAAPGLKSPVTRMLKAGEKLSDLHEISRFESIVSFNDRERQAPWIKVKTSAGETGWVFGDALEPAATRADWKLQLRMRCYFGDALNTRRNDFVIARGPATPEALAEQYREAIALRDTFAVLLANRAETSESGSRLDFSWLAAALPHFVYQRISGGTQPHLFADYRYWNTLAAGLDDKQCRTFFEVYLFAFPVDSIESFSPSWTFPVSENEIASQLGSGQHLAMLEAIQKAKNTGPLFAPELQQMKERVLDDILDKKTVFWQSREKILQEMDAILASGLPCLGDQDMTALKARRGMFADPAGNGIRVNLRSGE